MDRRRRNPDRLHRAGQSLGERLLRKVGYASLRHNCKLRDELLNVEVFYSLREAEVLIESWRRHFNNVRPHGSLGHVPPAPEAVLPRAADRSRYGRVRQLWKARHRPNQMWR